MGLKKKLEGIVLGQITGIVLKKVAAGDFGAGPKKLYEMLVGHKTQIAALLALPPLVMEALVRSGTCEAFTLPCDLWSSKVTGVLVSAAAALAYIGQVDGALRMPPASLPGPKPSDLKG